MHTHLSPLLERTILKIATMHPFISFENSVSICQISLFANGTEEFTLDTFIVVYILLQMWWSSEGIVRLGKSQKLSIGKLTKSVFQVTVIA